MPSIIPAILENTREGFESKLSQILKIPDLQKIQIDISDGIFTPDKTFDISEIDILNPAYSWEAHLMVNEPRKYFLDLKISGFNSVVVHYESVEDKNDLEKMAKELEDLKMAPSLALNPETEAESIAPFIKFFPQILVMSVHPGRQGTEFIESTYEKLKKLKNAYKEAIIEVDGGVKADNAGKLVRDGADALIVGLGLYETEPESELLPEEIVIQNYEKIKIETLNL